ncbi:MAG: leucine-rich repeat protein [Bacteroidaceae bacterium]|nr:leucine-rich repeat protein [Bacteroidaceae bacterium]
MTKFSFFKFIPKYIESSSGRFLVDNNGIALSFEPSKDNEYIIEETELNTYNQHHPNKSIKTLIVPKGVKGFASEFMRGVRVIEKFELPDGLLSIGNNSFDFEHSQHCVFANCILPSVIIPDSVKEIGTFAFGHTHIETLQIPSSLHSPYGRQFKDSYIGTLILPREWKDIAFLNKYNRLVIELDSVNYGYLRWPSTTVGKLIFY